MKPLRVHPLWIGSVLGFILLLIVWNCFVQTGRHSGRHPNRRGGRLRSVLLYR